VEAGDVGVVAAGRETQRGVVVYVGSWRDGCAGTCGPDRDHLWGLEVTRRRTTVWECRSGRWAGCYDTITDRDATCRHRTWRAAG